MCLVSFSHSSAKKSAGVSPASPSSSTSVSSKRWQQTSALSPTMLAALSWEHSTNAPNRPWGCCKCLCGCRPISELSGNTNEYNVCCVSALSAPHISHGLTTSQLPLLSLPHFHDLACRPSIHQSEPRWWQLHAAIKSKVRSGTNGTNGTTNGATKTRHFWHVGREWHRRIEDFELPCHYSQHSQHSQYFPTSDFPTQLKRAQLLAQQAASLLPPTPPVMSAASFRLGAVISRQCFETCFLLNL